MQIELGLIGAVALMGIAVQLRILKVLQRKLHEITEEQKRQDEEAELAVAGGFAHIMRERDEWEKDHLIEVGKLGSHLRTRSVTMIAARSAYKLHGAKMILGAFHAVVVMTALLTVC